MLQQPIFSIPIFHHIVNRAKRCRSDDEFLGRGVWFEEVFEEVLYLKGYIIGKITFHVL